MKPVASEQEIALLQESVQWIRPIGREFAHSFYTELFTSHPEVRSIFPEVMDRQEERLIEMLIYLIDGMANFRKIEPLVENLGRRHISYGVLPEHYSAVGEALIKTLTVAAGDRWTPEIQAAWIKAYHLLSDRMPK